MIELCKRIAIYFPNFSTERCDVFGEVDALGYTSGVRTPKRIPCLEYYTPTTEG